MPFKVVLRRNQAPLDRRHATQDPAGDFLAEFHHRAPAFTARQAGPKDEAFLYALFAATQAEALPLPEPLVAIQFQSQRAAYAARFPTATDLIVERSGRPIGRFMVDWSPSDHVQGVDLAVLPGERRGAPGLSLMRAWTAVCDRLGKPARLSVRPGNPAMSLYRKLGFLKVVDTSVPVVMERAARPRSIIPGESFSRRMK